MTGAPGVLGLKLCSLEYLRGDQFSSSFHFQRLTRSSWVNCALRDEEAVYWVSVSVAHYEAVAVGN